MFEYSLEYLYSDYRRTRLEMQEKMREQDAYIIIYYYRLVQHPVLRCPHSTPGISNHTVNTIVIRGISPLDREA